MPDQHPVITQIDAIAAMEDRGAAASLRDALLADMAALGAPPAVIASARRIMDGRA